MDRISSAWSSPGLGVGVSCGIASAIFYTISNIALRQSTSVDPFLVAAVKSAPTVLFLAPVALAWQRRSSSSIIQSRRAAFQFAGVSLVGQVVGNGAFQIALGSIGLAASVPIAFGSLLIGGAVLGRWFLGEPVSARKMIAISMLVIAVVVLARSQPSDLDARADNATSEWSLLHAPSWFGALCAIACGAAYAFFSTLMRRSMQRGMPALGAMWISGLVGTVALWAITLTLSGVEPVVAANPSQWRAMIMGGLFNFVAFLAISTALRILPVVAVHLLNASQVAMAAVAGVYLFAEDVTPRLLIGVAMTLSGLLLLAKPQRTASGSPIADS
ncbi:MAG: DMT family transporter [Planctomycetota bacterium]